MGTLDHYLSVAGDATSHAASVVLVFLEGGSLLGGLVKDTMIAVGIGLFSSLFVNTLIRRREEKRRKRETKAIRKFVLQAAEKAHASIREAIANFNAKDAKWLRTRIKRLAAQLQNVQAISMAPIYAAYSFLSSRQKEAFGDYLSAIHWEEDSTLEDAMVWVKDINDKYRAVMEACDGYMSQVWTPQQIMLIKADLQRLAAPVTPATSQVDGSAFPPINGVADAALKDSFGPNPPILAQTGLSHSPI